MRVECGEVRVDEMDEVRVDVGDVGALRDLGDVGNRVQLLS